MRDDKDLLDLDIIRSEVVKQVEGTTSPPAEGFYANYDTLEILGKGMTSVVRRAVEKKTGIEYAVKIMDISDLKNPSCLNADGLNVRQQALREIRVLRKVSHHEFIIHLHQVYESTNHMFLVFEICVRGELFDLIYDEVISENRAKKIIHQLLVAVDYLHSLNIIHRDLKPENVLLDHNYDIKLTDFGFAKTLRSDELLYETCGTPLYLAPEVLKNGFPLRFPRSESGYNFKADCWSIGIILYNLLSGGVPPYKMNVKTTVLIRAILDTKEIYYNPKIWSEVSDDAKDLVNKLLNINPEERIDIKEALAHPFFKESIPKVVVESEPETPEEVQEVPRSVILRRKFRILIKSVLFLVRLSRLEINSTSVDMFDIYHNPCTVKQYRNEMRQFGFDLYQQSCRISPSKNKKLLPHFFQHKPPRRQLDI